MSEQVMERSGGNNKYRAFPELQQAIRALSNVCDGAVKHDDHGYNGRDARYMNDLAAKPLLSYKQASIAYKVLRIYRKQLARYGIQYDAIPVPQEDSPMDPSDQQPQESHSPDKQPAERKHQVERIKSATKQGHNMIRVKFMSERNEFYDLLTKIKSLPGRRFDPTTKTWMIPISTTAIRQLVEWGFDVDQELVDIGKSKQHEKKPAQVQIPGLYPFQEQGVKFIIEKQGRCLIGDEMGLGKTVQALAYLKLHPEVRPALIICPASLKINWQREAKKWTGETPFIIYGRNNAAAYKNKKVIIINYDILHDHLEALAELKPQVVIMDEVHYIKTPDTKRTKAAKVIGKAADRVIALSGTPITNRPIEFFSILNILNPDVFSGRFRFAMRYCGAHHNGFGWNFNGSSNIEELHQLLTDTVMLRRLKCNVLQDLPQKQRSVIPMLLDNREQYNQAEADLMAWIEENEGKEAADRASRAEVLTRFEKLKQLTVRGKMSMVYDWVDDFLESGQKLVLFATHHETIDALTARYKDVCVKVDGRDSAESRQKAVDSFQNNADVKLFVGNIKAAGVGLTLTAASNVAFVELDWVPGNHDQAEDRVHRIGQTADSINAWYLIADSTIEDDIMDILDSKRKVLDAVLDGEETDEGSLLRGLLNKYRK